ncbi:MAG: ParM/StbA family protein [Prochloraceae cyanobacterium]|nr:ParM/StbA family protein [Prochloraceae cyanobacterium]
MKLVITVDVGASLTKIIYRLWKNSKEWQQGQICMSPLSEKITHQKLKDYLDFKGWVGMPSPEDEAYISVDDQYYVVGELAKEFDAEDRTFERKYENALYKVLAAIAVVLETNQIKNKKQIPIWVSVLLPWEEYNDRKRFTTQLLKYLGNYKFRGQSVKVKASQKTIMVMPEGGGIATAYCLKKGAQHLKGKTVGIAMFGHQNVTGLILKNGKLVAGESPKIGLTWFLDRAIALTSDLNREKLLKAIVQCLSELEIDRGTRYKKPDSWIDSPEGKRFQLGLTMRPSYDGNYEGIKSLATARSKDLREEEVKDISRAIAKARSEYFEKIAKWLSKMFPLQETDYLIFSGGAVLFIKQQLESYCNSYRPIETEKGHKTDIYKYIRLKGVGEYVGFSEPYIELVSDRDFATVVRENLEFSDREIEELSLDARFVDGYGIFEFTLGMVTELEQQQKAEATKKAKAAKKAAEAVKASDLSPEEIELAQAQ